MKPLFWLCIIVTAMFWLSFFGLGGFCVYLHSIEQTKPLSALVALDFALLVASVFALAITCDVATAVEKVKKKND